MGVGELKADLSGVLRAVETRGERVIVTRRGRPIAVVGPFEEGADEIAVPHWADELDGVVADIGDFGRIMREVVADRKKSRPRPVDLEK